MVSLKWSDIAGGGADRGAEAQLEEARQALQRRRPRDVVRKLAAPAADISVGGADISVRGAGISVCSGDCLPCVPPSSGDSPHLPPVRAG